MGQPLIEVKRTDYPTSRALRRKLRPCSDQKGVQTRLEIDCMMMPLKGESLEKQSSLRASLRTKGSTMTSLSIIYWQE